MINAATGFTVGAAPFLIFDTSAIASTDKTWTVLNFSGTIRPSTGAITAGHYLTTDANGLVIDGGAPGAGGTVTSVTISAPLSTTQAPITTIATLSCPTCVTSAAALTASRLVLGGGSQATSVLGSLGTTTTVLHGNAAGAPSFAAVGLTADVSGTLPVANGGTGTASTLVGLMRGNASAMTAAELSGDVTTSGSNVATIAANAVTAAKEAVVLTRRQCIIENDTQSATVLLDANITGRCDVPAASHVYEVAVFASSGTPTLTLERWRPNGGSVADILSATLPTAAAGAYACAKTTTAAACDSGITSSGTVTLAGGATIALAAKDVIRVKAATAGGVATWHHVTVSYTID